MTTLEAVHIADIKSQEAPSPFLPDSNIQFAWDSTSLGFLKTCPRLYYYQMIANWRNSREESVHLRFGIEYHQALQEYDISCANGADYGDALHHTIRELLIRTADWRPDHKYKNRDNLIRTVVWYLEQFKDDPAQTFIRSDGTPAVEVSFRFALDWGPMGQKYGPQSNEQFKSDNPWQAYLLSGHLDRVVVYQDEMFVMDRKTTTSTPGSYYFDQYQPNNQMSLYILASQIVMASPIKGVIIDAAQVGVGFSRFVRGMTYRTKEQINEWLEDLAFWLKQAEIYALENYWPQNDTACDKFGGCRFREICSKSPQVRETFLKSNYEKGEPWNPLKARGWLMPFLTGLITIQSMVC